MKRKALALFLVIAAVLSLLPAAVSARETCWVKCTLSSCPGYCYCYDGPSDMKSENLGRFNDGDELTFYGYSEKSNKWSHVSGWNTKGDYVNGYVHTASITFEEPGGEAPVMMVIESYRTDCPGYCYCYSKASDINGDNLGRFNDGDEVEYIRTEGKWYYVGGWNTYGHYIYGYIHSDCARFEDDDPGEKIYVYVDSYRTDCPGYCYCYSEASDINGENLGRFDNGDELEYLGLGKANNKKWAYVAGYNTYGRYVTGYVHMDCISFE